MESNSKNLYATMGTLHLSTSINILKEFAGYKNKINHNDKNLCR
ncbi:hypothetical protein [Flavobacterium sp. DSR2-3-3]